MSKLQDPKDQIMFTQVKHYGLEEMHNRNSHNQLPIKFTLLNRAMKMSICKLCNKNYIQHDCTMLKLEVLITGWQRGFKNKTGKKTVKRNSVYRVQSPVVCHVGGFLLLVGKTLGCAMSAGLG